MPKDFKRVMSVSLSVLAVVVIVLLGLVALLRADINRRTDKVLELKDKAALRYKAIEALASLQRDSEKARVERLSLITILPISDKLINFPRDISSLAKKHNVEIGFSFGEEISGTETDPGYLSFSMTANASFINWLNFISSIERGSYIVSFDSFNLVGDEKNFKSIIDGKVFSQ
tara:strand:- start:689 stop:1210 length:522 start_codon:yes stop_codon:yes gene_type:complete